jgi:hypothetical protein
MLTWIKIKVTVRDIHEISGLQSGVRVRFHGSKAVPQHTYGGAGGRGCIAPTPTLPQH